MADNEQNNEQPNEKNKKDLMLKNFDFVSQAYFQAEGVFPLWEAAFALIVGQIIVAYFNPGVCPDQQKFLAGIGLSISVIWFILVSLNLQNAYHMGNEVKRLQKQLNELNYGYGSFEFISPWPESKNDWTMEGIFWGTQPIKDQQINEAKREWLAKTIKSTWFYRRVLPLFAGLVWLYFLNLYAVIIVIIIILFHFSVMFHPKKDPSQKPGQEEAKKKGWW